MGRRDSSDEKWIRTKDRIRKRDKHKDRIFRRLSAKDAFLLKKNAGKLIERLDAAHIFPVSLYPELCYVDVNIVLLNRYSHSMLDDFKDPITGGSISKEMVYEWWRKIAGEKQWQALMTIMGVEEEQEDGEAV
jgi:hypothetical protein